jgi:hypothetical protein
VSKSTHRANKRWYKNNLKRLTKNRPMVWKRLGWGDWGVGGYTKEGYKFFGSYESEELANLAADLIQLEKT